MAVRLTILPFCLLISSLLLQAIAHEDPLRFNWEAITPTTDIEYHDCYKGFQCARIELPLDWKNAADNRTISLAIIKLPATVHDDDPSFGGPIFSNPGGPGESGIDFMLHDGKRIQSIVDSHRHYEIISWDIRGIGSSTPKSRCYRNLLEHDAAQLQQHSAGTLQVDHSALKYNLAMAVSHGQSCKALSEENKNILDYTATTYIARDMIAMADKIEELRRKERQKRAIERGETVKVQRKTTEDVVRLQYIGFSWGTVLGMYFASLFPGRVGRFILDGVVDIHDYATGPGLLRSTVDSNAIFEKFFEGCFEAGSFVCPLKTDADVGPEDIKSCVRDLIVQLDQHPHAFQNGGEVAFITGLDLRKIFAAAFYKPATSFKSVAHIMTEALAGNFTAVIKKLVEVGEIPILTKDAEMVISNETDDRFLMRRMGEDALLAIICADGDDVTNKSESYWNNYTGKQAAQSFVLGNFWSFQRVKCSSWPFRPSWRFTGPFTTPHADASNPNAPAAPILFLSNRLDHVTPLRLARAMRHLHPGAGLVVQETVRHCLMSSQPGDCSKNIIREYLECGTVPKEETFCEPECEPWDETCPLEEGRKRSIKKQEMPFKLRHFPLGYQ